MIEIIASSYVEFFPGDFLVFGAIGVYFYIKKDKEEDDFYGK
tara:strand:+ start:12 stop:137 length:126 start_codon:yes stop_codon:yes gene_type:complete